LQGFVGAIHWLKSWQSQTRVRLVECVCQKAYQDMQGTIAKCSVKTIPSDENGWPGWVIVTDDEIFFIAII